MPAPCTARASTPGNGPRPTAATKISARMISLMPRMMLSTWRMKWKTADVRREVARGQEAHRYRQHRWPAACPRWRSAPSRWQAPRACRGKPSSAGTCGERKSPIHGTPLTSSPALTCAAARGPPQHADREGRQAQAAEPPAGCRPLAARASGCSEPILLMISPGLLEFELVKRRAARRGAPIRAAHRRRPRRRDRCGAARLRSARRACPRTPRGPAATPTMRSPNSRA